jgi:hypothetical protein
MIVHPASRSVERSCLEEIVASSRFHQEAGAATRR